MRDIHQFLKNEGLKVTNIIHGTPWIEVYKELIEEVKPTDYCFTKSDDEEFLFIKETNIKGIYSFGMEQLKDSYDHKAGYIWSSRASVMNKEFGTALTEVVLKYKDGSTDGRFSMDVYYLKPLMEDYLGKELWIKEYKTFNDEPIFRFEEVGK